MSLTTRSGEPTCIVGFCLIFILHTITINQKSSVLQVMLSVQMELNRNKGLPVMPLEVRLRLHFLTLKPKPSYPSLLKKVLKDLNDRTIKGSHSRVWLNEMRSSSCPNRVIKKISRKIVHISSIAIHIPEAIYIPKLIEKPKTSVHDRRSRRQKQKSALE